MWRDELSVSTAANCDLLPVIHGREWRSDRYCIRAPVRLVGLGAVTRGSNSSVLSQSTENVCVFTYSHTGTLLEMPDEVC